MAIALPTSADVRKAREQANDFVSARYDLVRTPFLAWVGANDLALATLRELPERLTPQELRKRADKVTEQARTTYEEWAKRGEVAVEKIKTRPQVDRALRTARDTDKRIERQVETLVDQVHDAGEDILGRVTFETRSVGEKAARRTQGLAGDAAANVSGASDELAEGIREAGDEAARETRSASRKAASRTAPAKTTNGRRTSTTS